MDALSRAKLSLEGLSVGDAFGQMFFTDNETIREHLGNRTLFDKPWYLTDDTIMSLAIVDTLKAFNEINQDHLAKLFGQNYLKNPRRGYGGTAHGMLQRFSNGDDWRHVAPQAFGGIGSCGNGAAMRAGPIGAYFADDLEQVKTEAWKSAVVTHNHLEGQVGALAIALAAAWAWRNASNDNNAQPMLEFVRNQLPESDVQGGLGRAQSLSADASIELAVSVLGNGSDLTAQDTVPLAIWCASRYLGSYESALWFTVSALGDRDTTCAMVGSIVALSVGSKGIPETWVRSRESLESWAGSDEKWF